MGTSGEERSGRSLPVKAVLGDERWGSITTDPQFPISVALGGVCWDKR